MIERAAKLYWRFRWTFLPPGEPAELRRDRFRRYSWNLIKIVSCVVAALVLFVGVAKGSRWAAGHGADAGDLVNFMGGAFGSLLAVSGVIFIEERKRKLEIKNRDQRLMDLLQNLRDGLKKWSGSVIMVDGLTHIRLMEFFDILSLSNVILKGGGATSHLSRIRQIVAVDKVSAALAELEPTLLEAKAILNAGWAADGVYLALVKIWPGLSAVFFSVNGIWDSLGEIYEADYPWGWPVEPPSCHRVCLGSGDIAS